MKRKGGLVAAALAAVALLAVGCQPLANIGEKWNPKGQHFIKLVVGAPQSGRAISVTDYQVTRLSIEVRDPDDVVVDTIDWYPSEGDTSHMVPVEKTGEYTITVIHFSEHDGHSVAATESRTFTIGAMVITEIEIVPGSIGVIHLQGDDTQSAADGTLTLHLTGVEAPDGAFVAAAVFSPDMDPADPLPSMVAGLGGYLEGGGLDSTAHVAGNLDTWVGTGGTAYQVAVWVDVNDNLNTVMYPEPGIDLQLIYFPFFSVEINGNIDLYFTGADFITVPSP